MTKSRELNKPDKTKELKKAAQDLLNFMLIESVKRQSGIKLLSQMLERNADPAAKNGQGETAISVAQENGDREVINLLRNAQQKTTEKEQKSEPLTESNGKKKKKKKKHLAKTATTADPEIEHKLTKEDLAKLQKDINNAIEKSDLTELRTLINQATPTILIDGLSCAVSLGRKEAAEIFLQEAGVPAYIADSSGRNALHNAAIHDKINILELILQIAPEIDVNFQDSLGQTAVFYAAAAGSSKIIDRLVQHGANVTIANKGGMTPLYIAQFLGHPKKVDYALQSRETADQQQMRLIFPKPGANEKSHESLCVAAQFGLNDYVDQLIKNGTPINPEQSDKTSPLMAAILGGHRKAAEFLLEAKPDLNYVNANNKTALDLAINCNQTGILSDLLDARANANNCASGMPPLIRAVMRVNSHAVGLLLQHKAEIDALYDNGEDTQTALFMAASLGNLEIVQKLCEAGADINILSSKNISSKSISPYEIAKKNGHTEIAKYFEEKYRSEEKGKIEAEVKNTAHANSEDKLQQRVKVLYLAVERNLLRTVTRKLESEDPVQKSIHPDTPYQGKDLPLFIASSNGYLEIVELLIQHGADVNKKSKSDKTAREIAQENGHKKVVAAIDEQNKKLLHTASETGDVEKVKMVLSQGIAVDSINEENGNTPLIAAIIANQFKVADALLEAGANPNQRDMGYTPLYVAARNGNIEIVKLLLKHRAKVNLVSENGETPIAIAEHFGQEEVVKLLFGAFANVNSEALQQSYKNIQIKNLKEVLEEAELEEESRDFILQQIENYTLEDKTPPYSQVKKISELSATEKRDELIQGLSNAGKTKPDKARLSNLLSEITNLNLRNENIGQEGLVLLAELLEKNETITTLNLSNTGMRSRGAEALAAMLKENKLIKTLLLSDNQIDGLGMIALAKMLSVNETLTSLNMAFNKMQEQDLKNLAWGLSRNKALKYINISNIFGHHEYGDAHRALANIFHVNDSLEYVDLSGNNLGPDCVKLIAEMIDANPNSKLVDLNLGRNEMSPESAQRLLDVVDAKQCVRIHIANNNLPEAYAKSAAQINAARLPAALASFAERAELKAPKPEQRKGTIAQEIKEKSAGRVR